MLPFVSLDAAGATGAGEVKDLETSLHHHTFVVTKTGNPSAFRVRCEVSQDGENWFTPAILDETGPPWWANVEGSWRYVRANLTDLQGGTSPTVTVTVASS